jgi:hypothetical protein
MIYETKGLSLEQVDELYGTVNKAWKSKDFVPQITFVDVDQAAQKGMALNDIGEAQTRKRSVQHEETVGKTDDSHAVNAVGTTGAIGSL